MCMLVRFEVCYVFFFFFFKQKTAYEMQRGLVGSECVQETVSTQSTWDNQAYNNLLKVAGEEFQKDYAREKEDFQQAAPHEEFSAYILIKYFKDVQNELDDFDPVLAARMITGCVHMDVSSKKNAAENCLIQLINGSSIDVDKLDYIARDTWASGVNNNSIDTHRLLSALEIVERESGLSVVFQKSALSVVQSVVDGRNFLYRWIYSHHMVLYYNHLWENALKKLEKIVPKNEENNKTILDTMFSEQSFANPSMHENYSIYLPSDGDIYFLLKCHLNDIPEVRELLSRKLSKIPLWKTYAEFSLFFKDRNDRQIAKICARSSNCLSSLLDCSSDDIFLKKIKPKYAEISKNDINIKLSDNEFISYEAAVDQKTSSHETFEYFYVFIPKSKESRKGECIERLRTLPVQQRQQVSSIAIASCYLKLSLIHI
eukprot:TRINITY_DN21868_c0_g1_i2.p1 TRINITY_DN21868_c0_g1~~TRINITY_DN21868_c0_g1_i2.p1  ORF type:complete len:429 (+),score=79.00 TRINITY_DN21868_c0_g1_i2:48-1334(+)